METPAHTHTQEGIANHAQIHTHTHFTTLGWSPQCPQWESGEEGPHVEGHGDVFGHKVGDPCPCWRADTHSLCGCVRPSGQDLHSLLLLPPPLWGRNAPGRRQTQTHVGIGAICWAGGKATRGNYDHRIIEYGGNSAVSPLLSQAHRHICKYTCNTKISTNTRTHTQQHTPAHTKTFTHKCT